MRIQVVTVGRLKAGSERDLAGRYLDRAVALGRTLGFTGPDVVELPESRRRRADERRTEEEEAIRARAGPASLVILDEAAPSPSSEDFATRLVGFRDGGRALAFVIGGPDGLAAGIRDEAEWSLSFGRLTMPHQLVRVVLLEQVYRAFTIISGHPYHRAGEPREP